MDFHFRKLGHLADTSKPLSRQEFLITHDKIPVLISNLITTEVWKEKVFPHILKKVSRESSFQLYMMVGGKTGKFHVRMSGKHHLKAKGR